MSSVEEAYKIRNINSSKSISLIRVYIFILFVFSLLTYFFKSLIHLDYIIFLSIFYVFVDFYIISSIIKLIMSKSLAPILRKKNYLNLALFLIFLAVKVCLIIYSKNSNL